MAANHGDWRENSLKIGKIKQRRRPKGFDAARYFLEVLESVRGIIGQTYVKIIILFVKLVKNYNNKFIRLNAA